MTATPHDAGPPFLCRERTGRMKTAICTAAGVIGGAIAALFGGWDTALTTLVICMAIDYISGLVVAGVFHASKKSENGALESRAGWKGLCRKGMTLLAGTNYIRDSVVIGFVANEVISIVENAGLMGLPLPAAITKAIDILTAKATKHENSGDE